MYTRKRRKHKGGSNMTLRSANRTLRSGSRSGASQSRIRYLIVNSPNRSRRSSSYELKQNRDEPYGIGRQGKQLSLEGQLVNTKSGTIITRDQRTPIACRISLLQRIMLTRVKKLKGEIKLSQREALDIMKKQMLSQEDIHTFISLNSSTFFHFDTYEIDKTILNIKKAVKGKRGKKVLLPIVFFRENGTIPHYFILYYDKGKWYIYSSYGSDYVCICLQKIPVDFDVFIKFMHAMNTPLDERTEDDISTIRDFMKTYFLANAIQQRVRTENSHGNTVTFFCNIKKGIEKETEEYLTQHIRVEFVPRFAEAVKEHMKTIYRSEFEKMGLYSIHEG